MGEETGLNSEPGGQWGSRAKEQAVCSSGARRPVGVVLGELLRQATHPLGAMSAEEPRQISGAAGIRAGPA